MTEAKSGFLNSLTKVWFKQPVLNVFQINMKYRNQDLLANYIYAKETFFEKDLMLKVTIGHILLTAKATKTHFYWAMRNNDGSEAGFQQYLLNIVDHYQVNNTPDLRHIIFDSSRLSLLNWS